VKPLFRLVALRVQMLGHAVTELRRGGAFKFLVVAVFGVLLVGMLFQAITFGFRFLRGYPEFQGLLVPYLFSIYFLTMLLMLTFSNAVISFGSLYRSPETQLLMTLPLEPRTVYTYKVGESLLFSSWAFLVLGGPLLVSFGLYGAMDKAHWSFYPAAALLILPFVFIPASLGAAISMLLTRFFPRRPGRVLGLLFAGLAVACLVAAGWLGIRAGLMEPTGAVDEHLVQRIMDNFAFSRSPWAPSNWLAEGLLAAVALDWREAAFNWGLLASTALALWMLADLTAERLYAASFSRASGTPTRRVYRTGGALDLLGRFGARFAPVTARLLVKDLRTFARDPVQWSQVLIFFGLLFIYVANLRNLGYQRIVLEHVQNLRWTSFVSFTNLAAAGLTLATLTTRFVFPMISMEGRRFWVLALLPVRRSRLLFGKYIFSLGGSLLLIVPLALLGAWMLGTPGQMAWIHLVTALCMCLGLPAIAVGMGAVFPNYREESPAKIVSGFGGTLCLVMSIAFVGLLVLGVGMYCHQQINLAEGVVRLGRPAVLAMAAAAAASVLTAVVPLALGCRAINRAEL
jgi:ABC-2 type transport system permease protein